MRVARTRREPHSAKAAASRENVAADHAAADVRLVSRRNNPRSSEAIPAKLSWFSGNSSITCSTLSRYSTMKPAYDRAARHQASIRTTGGQTLDHEHEARRDHRGHRREAVRPPGRRGPLHR